MQRLCTYSLITLLLTGLPAIAHAPAPRLDPTPHAALTRAVRAKNPTPFQVGIGSWYGSWFQGKETTSGERFNMFALTAAHKYLPFGTRVRVTNLLNQRSVVVRINDRGPVPAGRVIDLSYAAARALHFYEDGLIPVRLDIVPQ